MSSIGPVWHANLTWLVVLGGLLFGAFPLAYGVILSALYIPLVIMLFGLIFRGVSFDFRQEARRQGPWNLAFGWGSLVAALAQGLAVGGFLSGFKVEGGRFAGSGLGLAQPLGGPGGPGPGVRLPPPGRRLPHPEDRRRSPARQLTAMPRRGPGPCCCWPRAWVCGPSSSTPSWPGSGSSGRPCGLPPFPCPWRASSLVMLISSLLKLQENGPFLWSLLLFFFGFPGHGRQPAPLRRAAGHHAPRRPRPRP